MLPVLLSPLVLQFFHLLNIELESGDRLPLDLLIRRVEIIQHSRPLSMILVPSMFGQILLLLHVLLIGLLLLLVLDYLLMDSLQLQLRLVH